MENGTVAGIAPKSVLRIRSTIVYQVITYTWANSSWQRMEAIGRQEMAYSKHARARSNCYKDGDYGGNAYRGSNHRDGHFTHRSQMGIGNFSSYGKAFDHICHEEYFDNSPYGIHKGYHGSHDSSDQNCGREVNHEGLIGENDYVSGLSRKSEKDERSKEKQSEFEKREQERENESLIENQERYKEEQQEKKIVAIEKSKFFICAEILEEFSPAFLHHNMNEWKETCHGVQRARRKRWRKTILMLWRSLDGPLFSLLGDHCVKFQEEVVENFQYVLTSLDTYVKNLVEQVILDKPLLVVKIVNF
ncbi:hypothetical protein M9H77_08702 [Catharanthus roseus]|uniref:Uncharacterized protein n=1 Tax=Catharanthus roseus TaxID=4058 RepID=A0ACC0BYF7_CATRO|nr:hypothetical protein M9H77_08702 [Catharanthus roseus]